MKKGKQVIYEKPNDHQMHILNMRLEKQAQKDAVTPGKRGPKPKYPNLAREAAKAKGLKGY